MALEIPPKQMAGYQATAQRRLEEKRRNLALHYQRACKVVQQASHLLKKEFGARQVVAFGSVLFPERFHLRSDIDLAVWGLDEKDYYRAVAHLLDLDPTISIDLIEAEQAPPTLLAVIEHEGKLL